MDEKGNLQIHRQQERRESVFTAPKEIETLQDQQQNQQQNQQEMRNVGEVVQEPTQVERVVIEENKQEQTVPVQRAPVYEPAPPQRVGRKEQKKRQSRRKKEASAALSARLETIRTQAQNAPGEHQNIVLGSLREKNYGRLFLDASNNSPAATAHRERNRAFYRKYPALSSGGITRDISELAGSTDVTDEQLLTLYRNLMSFDTSKNNPEEHRRASQVLLPTFNAAFERVRNGMVTAGLTDDAPFASNEDIVMRCAKVTELYRFSQITRDISRNMPPDLVPMETYAFLFATCEYCIAMVQAANLCMKDQKDKKAQFRKNSADGLYKFRPYYERGLEAYEAYHSRG